MGVTRDMDRPHLRTERIDLRPLRASDAERLATLIGDIEVCKTLARVPYPYSVEDAADAIARKTSRGPAEQVDFVIDLGDGLAGSVTLRSLAETADIGFWLARPYWGQGLMSEAAGAALQWLLDTTEHDEILSGCFDGNPASLRVQHKLGFEIVGQHKVHCLALGQDLPHIDSRLTRTGFKDRI